jgi:hypothetical protein
MPKHQIMDPRLGHDEKAWDKADVVAVKEAQARFEDLTKKGFSAIVKGEAGAKDRRITAFDPDADVLFIPALQGG